MRTDVADLRDVNSSWRSSTTPGARMSEEGVPAREVRVAYAADMRYVGQAYELEVPIAAPDARARGRDRRHIPPLTSACTATRGRSSSWSS